MALMFSAVTVTAGYDETEFTVGGIPREYDDLVGWIAFDDFMENVDAETEVTDEDLQNGITERLNEVIADPERIEIPESAYEESQEVKRMSAEIVKTLDTIGFDKEALKQKMLTCVSEKYKCLGTEVTTAQSLKDTFKSASPLTAYDSALADQAVSEIHLQRNGEISLTLINGQRIGKEETA